MREGESVSLGRFGRARLIRSAADPAVDPVEFEFELAPGAAGPPSHFHPHQEERWQVKEGVMELRLGRRTMHLAAGESAAAAPGTAHSFRNGGDQPLRFEDAHLPAGSFQRYIEQLAKVLEHGGGRDPRTLLRLAGLVAAQGEDQRPAGLAARLMLSVGAGAARLLHL